jgi:hypothetical protein
VTALIFFAGGEPLRTTSEWDAHSVAHALAGSDQRAHRIADFVEMELGEQRVLINPTMVTYIQTVNP